MTIGTSPMTDPPTSVRRSPYGEVLLFFGGKTPRGHARWFWSCPSYGFPNRSPIDWGTADCAFRHAIRACAYKTAKRPEKEGDGTDSG